MSFQLVSIVEGDGEVQALPVLLRGIAAWLAPERRISVPRPIQTPRDRFLQRDAERRKVLELAVRLCAHAPDGGHIIVLLDADDDCPATLGSELKTTCEGIVDGRTGLSAVLANREFEAWFLASGTSMQGVRGFDRTRLSGHWTGSDPDEPRNAKGLIHEATGRRYRSVKDQAALSARIDPALAERRSRSFRKLVAECRRALKIA